MKNLIELVVDPNGFEDELFAALERSGMREVICQRCGSKGLTRDDDTDLCPPCRKAPPDA